MGLFAYFSFHIRHGRHGLEAQSRLMARSTVLEFEIRSLQAVSDSLGRDVAALRDDPPNPDIVEEFGRKTLGFAYPNDRLFRLSR
ncbi:MAG: septum formation initiator family protein [Pseudomonadota bacterium]